MPSDARCTVRPAVAADAAALTALARAAKASWGYPPAWLAAWAEELAVSEAFAASGDVLVAERAGRPLGFAGAVRGTGAGEWVLEHLWVDPECQRRGVGARLLEHLRGHVRRRGGTRLTVVSDPQAEGFYLRQSAVRRGTVRTSVTGTERALPRLAFDPV